MKTIKISDDVWNKIASYGKFGENENDVLERIFKINEKKISVKRRQSNALLPPDGTKCRFTYNSISAEGNISNRKLVIPDVGEFTSFSKPACEITQKSLNGWLYWRILLPESSTWISANEWRGTSRDTAMPKQMKEQWYSVVLDVIIKLCFENDSKYFTFKDLEKRKLIEIIERTKSTGRTPQKTLHFFLQRLRDEGKIEFLDNGNYRLL